MKIFFYMGRNPQTKSGVSWKIWKIQLRGRTVTTFWGRAVIDKHRRVIPQATLQSKSRTFTSANQAALHERRLVASKLHKGYQRRTRWR
jgi:predicted DNA-binding WGR domain protein